MSENKTNNTVTCDSCGHSARIHPQLADKYVQPISHQLRQLRHAQLVKFSKSGKEVIYSLDDEHVLTLFAQALDHVKHKV